MTAKLVSRPVGLGPPAPQLLERRGPAGGPAVGQQLPQ